MKVLLSIKPEFVEKIFDGTKQFEYRRSIFRRQDITSIVVYATLPVGMIMGEFEVEEVICGTPRNLWDNTRDFAGVSRSFFFQYFSGRATGYAIRVGAIRKFAHGLDPYSLWCDFSAPQSFRYIEDSWETQVNSCLAGRQAGELQAALPVY